MKIVTSKELAKVPNGSLILDLNAGKSAAPNEIDLYNDMIPQIFCGNYGCKEDQDKGYWNGMCYLYPFNGSCGIIPFLDSDINSGKDIYELDSDDILFSVDTDSNDYSKDALFAVYNENEKRAFVKNLLDYLGYSIEDLKKILEK